MEIFGETIAASCPIWPSRSAPGSSAARPGLIRLRDQMEELEAQRLIATGSSLDRVRLRGPRRARRGRAENRPQGLMPDEIAEDVFAQHLYAPDLPDPDLLIRTSGELRISNFLLWQLAYAELVFTDRRWPEFGPDDLREPWPHTRRASAVSEPDDGAPLADPDCRALLPVVFVVIWAGVGGDRSWSSPR